MRTLRLRIFDSHTHLEIIDFVIAVEFIPLKSMNFVGSDDDIPCSLWVIFAHNPITYITLYQSHL